MGFSQSFKNLFGADLSDVKKNKDNSSNSPTELVHINQEMYKKSAELAERNKTLALLEKINELILGSITKPEEIANEVTKLLVEEANFQVASIYLYDKSKKILRRLAISKINNKDIQIKLDDNNINIALANQENIIVQAIKKRASSFTDSTQNLYIEQLENPKRIKSVFIAPLFVRNELIGACTIALLEEQNDISEFHKDLLNRLVALIGIGIDNALLYNQVENANVRLKALDKLKNEFVSVASHELRTPMTAIKSYLWMALNDKGGPLNEKQRYYVERGYNSVDRLIRLVNDMLNISRIESGRITIEMRSVDLVKLTQDVVDEVLPRAHELEVAVKMQSNEEMPHVLADPDKIKEVIINLIGNSLKFTPKGGTINISFFKNDGFVGTKIVDTGIGIEPQDVGKLFQKFGLLPGSYITNQTAMGTGLGLYICRSIIDMHQGTIKAESEGRDKGATFTFTLKEIKDSDLQHIKKQESDSDKVDLIHAQL